ncbi:UMP kinase [Halopenitus persicus]|uniref:UMP kinase n=1 Tax=Halopenitus persicus TaxID=1048396 RepID=UPI000BBA9212|nr:UMP kinase [Halopenitus persicus]
MNVVISIGGSVLAPDLDPERVAAHAKAIEELSEAGCTVGVVVGGGGVAREYIETARDLGANGVQLDQLGIGVTRLNARLLIAALGQRATLSPAADYDEAVGSLRRGEIAVMGGVMPGQTTDAVAAEFAEAVDADLLVYATSANGVYDADPNVDPDAEQYGRLSPAELVDIVLPMSRDAGASAPVDLLAAKLIDRADLRTIVLDGTDPSVLTDAVLGGDHGGTDVVPETCAEPTRWVE